MKELKDFDIYYKGKLIDNILQIETTSYKPGETRLHIDYIDDKNKYQIISDLVNEFEFKDKDSCTVNQLSKGTGKLIFKDDGTMTLDYIENTIKEIIRYAEKGIENNYDRCGHNDIQEGKIQAYHDVINKCYKLME